MTLKCNCSRREFLRHGLYGITLSAGLPAILNETSAALAAQALQGTSFETHPERILVVVELSGGNDGLNTVVPFRDDTYYRVRPNLGIRADDVIEVEDGLGFHPALVGFERLYKDGNMAVVHGCGYENPSLSHFSSMGFWHTGVPNGGEPLGWMGRLADGVYDHDAQGNMIINIGTRQSMAVQSRHHPPLVFSNPDMLRRDGTGTEQAVLEKIGQAKPSDNSTLEFLSMTAQNAVQAGDVVRRASASYRTPIDYGIGGLSGPLRQTAALIAAELPTRLYYVSYQGNSFDTHVHQADPHARLLAYTADPVIGFVEDMKRIGRADNVAVMMFTEFGRRVEENASLGTDHGTATPMFVFGTGVSGGMYGRHPSLTDLDDGNLRMTTDFRHVYATMIDGWLGYKDHTAILKGSFSPLGMFA